MTAYAAFQNSTELPFLKWKKKRSVMKHAKPMKVTKRQNAEHLNDVKYRYLIQPEKQIVINYVNIWTM